MFLSITALVLLAIIVVTVLASLKRIPEGQVYTLHRGDRAQPELLTPGTHWIMPWRDHVSHKISLTGHALHVDEVLDEARRAQGVVYWQVLDPERADAVIDEVEALIRRHAVEGLRTETTADPIVRSVHLKNRLNDNLRPQGMLVTRVDMRATMAARVAA